ncbi:uncharacterized protein LOC117100612 [Anneissia japonica]|uniref:uncharacterized protein LOC117100612 n=1 Tax=Anneissia japonica TaxID=1529436 RepID=UPI001425909B|nr:uncharacterized protein LOC117100612 [Anneissia japonica]
MKMAETSDRVWKPDNAEIDVLIDLFQKNPCLWDNKSKTYHDKSIRNAAIQNIALELDTEVKNIKWKWNNIRTQYRREKSKEYMKSVSGVDDGYKSRWRLMDRLMFLDDSLAPRQIEWNLKRRLNLNNEEDEDCIEIDEEIISGNEADTALDCAALPKSMPSSTKQLVLKNKLSKKSRRDIGERQLLEKAILCLETATNKPNEPVSDPDYNFGRYVADELKAITDQSTKQMAKHRIHCILFEAQTNQGEHSMSYMTNT